MKNAELLKPILSFLKCETPDSWLEVAKEPCSLKVLLTDHLLCELKAAQSAMYLIRKYSVETASAQALLEWLKPYEDYVYRKQGDWRDLIKHNGLSKTILTNSNNQYHQLVVDKMVLLIKEELHHFYQVLELMHEMQIEYSNISSSRYAKGLLKHVKTYEPDAFVDKLICGAYIEARSCERFAKLAPLLPVKIGDFYLSLLRSEARHYQDYLSLAAVIADQDINPRIDYFGDIEAELILSSDPDFKFHSGAPLVSALIE